MPRQWRVRPASSVYYMPVGFSRGVEGPRDDRAGQIARTSRGVAALDRGGAQAALAWPQGLTDFARRTAQRVREWAAVEAAPGRLVPCLAIGFGIGTIIYFAIDREPAVSAA